MSGKVTSGFSPTSPDTAGSRSSTSSSPMRRKAGVRQSSGMDPQLETVRAMAVAGTARATARRCMSHNLCFRAWDKVTLPNRGSGPARPCPGRTPAPGRGERRPGAGVCELGSHTGDELVDPFIDGLERVLAQHGALGLVIEFEMDPIHGEVAPLLLRPADELTPEFGPGGLRWHRLGLEDLQVIDDTVHLAAVLKHVEQAAVAVAVVVGQIELGHARRGQRQVVLGAVTLQEQVLGDPVDLAGDGFEVLGLHRLQGALPQVEHTLTGGVGTVAVHVTLNLLQVLALDIQSAGLTSVRQAYLTAPGHVVADLPDGPDGVLERVVAHDHPGLDHAQHEIGRAQFEQRGGLAHVGVAYYHVQAAEPFGVGVGLVAGVDYGAGPGGGRGDALPYVLGALADAIQRAPGGLQDLAGPADDLAGDQEGNEDVGQTPELPVPSHEVVLMAAVGVARRVGVVLEQVDVTGDAFFVQALLGIDLQAFEDALAGLVVGHQVHEVVALGGGVLGVAAHIQVQACAVAQEHVAAASPRDHPAEEVAGDLVGRQPTLPPEGARDPVLVLQTEDASFHAASPTSRRRRRQRGHAACAHPVGAMPGGTAPYSSSSGQPSSPSSLSWLRPDAGFPVPERPSSRRVRRRRPWIRRNLRCSRARSRTATSRLPASSSRSSLLSSARARVALLRAEARVASAAKRSLSRPDTCSEEPPTATNPCSSTMEPSKVMR